MRDILRKESLKSSHNELITSRRTLMSGILKRFIGNTLPFTVTFQDYIVSFFTAIESIRFVETPFTFHSRSSFHFSGTNDQYQH